MGAKIDVVLDRRPLRGPRVELDDDEKFSRSRTMAIFLQNKFA